MKSIINITVSAFLVLIFSQSISAQKDTKQVVTDTIVVSGICDMCKERIENAALINGVKKVEWSSETQLLIVMYRPDKVGIEEIAKSLNEAGHDNELFLCTDEQYEKLHNCCRYRDSDPH